jgi:hypothetical protein
LTTKNPGDTLKLLIVKNNNRQQITVALAKKYQKPFSISFSPNQSALQKEIYQGWLNK